MPTDEQEASRTSLQRVEPAQAPVTVVVASIARRLTQRVVPEGCTYPVSRRFSVVLIDQSAQPIAASHRTAARGGRRTIRSCQI